MKTSPRERSGAAPRPATTGTAARPSSGGAPHEETHNAVAAHRGDADLAAVGALLADPGRCRVLLALDDGRALPATLLAAEAGVAPSTASGHLRKLVDAGMLTVERHGRHRYYRLAGEHVARLLETLAQLSPAQPVRSLRRHTRAQALRRARTCYDHLAGRLGVELMRVLLEKGHLVGGDGLFDPSVAERDRLSGSGHDIDYRLTPQGETFLAAFGVTWPPRRAAVRYCVDWSEQRHHLSGALGRGLHDRLLTLGWLTRAPASRAVHLTEAGRAGLADTFGVVLTD
ncbi:ArsR/SmtB family transcription factor [Streptomyces reniochalinae]|uniref:ArsR/SmtB family transcription factor n=1 Tax=Streptomyces reniochalinae TaxID=2250578 RepID=UPI00319E6D4D